MAISCKQRPPLNPIDELSKQELSTQSALGEDSDKSNGDQYVTIPK